MVVPPGGSERLLQVEETAPVRVTRQKTKESAVTNHEESPLHADRGRLMQMDDGFQSMDEGSTFRVDLSPIAPDRKSTRLNSSHSGESRMPSSA